MPPRGKAFYSKENPKAGVGGEKGLKDFQEYFKQFKSNPDAAAKKNGIFGEVERFIDDSGGQADRLARLCLARMKYELYSNDSKSCIKERELSEGRLKPLLASNHRSLLALSLLVAWYHKAATKGYDTWSVAEVRIRNLLVNCANPDSFEESAWIDPELEAINVTGNKEKFEDFKDGKTKSERIQPLIESVWKASDDVVKRTGHSKQTLVQLEALQPTDATTMQLVTQPDRFAAANVAEFLSKKKYLDAERQRDEEVARIMGVIVNKLKEHGLEGSSKRIEALCDLFTVTTQDFEIGMGDAIDRWLGEYGAQAMLKNYYTQQLSKQLRRLRSTGHALELRRPDLQEILNSTYSHGSAIDAGVYMGVSVKDDKGDVSVAGGSSARVSTGRRTGGKASARDQDKRVASTDDCSVQATVTDVHEFFQWFVNGLKEHGASLHRKVIEEALSELMDSRIHSLDDPEYMFLESCKVSGSQLVQALQLLPPENTGAEQDSDISLSSHIANRLLMGDVLLNAALAPDGLGGYDKWKTIDETTRERVQFASNLSRIPVLHRHEVVSVLASSMAVSASISNCQTDVNTALVCTLPFTLPPEPEMVLDRLGDPFIVLEGYAYMLCHKKLLPMRGESVQVDGWDETDMRLLRLCDWILHAKELLGAECILMAIALHESTKQEHVEMVRRLYGEMPSVLAKRMRKLQGAGAEVLSKLLNGGYTAESNGSGPPGLCANNANSEANNGASAEEHAGMGSWLEAPFSDFEIRTDLPASDRDAINTRWQQDVMDTLGALQEGGCGLGRRLSSTISSYIAEALGIKRTEVALANDALRGSLKRIETGHLLKLRFFLLSQLGLRAQGTLTGMRHRFEEFERSAKDEQWCLEVVTDAGRKGEKLRLSSDAFWRLYHKCRDERRRRIVRLRILHAMNQVIKESRRSTGGATPVAIIPSSTTQAGGGGKKKSRGTVVAAGAGDGTTLTLPPLPPGVQPLEDVKPHELFDHHTAESLASEAQLCLLLPSPEPVCIREVFELLNEVLDPPDAERTTARTEVEASVVAELVMSSSQLKYPSHDSIPAYTVVEVIEDLTRASVLDNVRRGMLDDLQAQLESLLKNWDGLNDVFRGKGESQQFLEELRPHVSDWLCDLLEQKVSKTQGYPPKVLTLLTEIEASKRILTAKAFELQSRTIRYSVLHYAARIKANRAIEEKLTKLLSNNTQQVQPAQPPQGAKLASKQSKARQGEESKRNEDLLTEQRYAKREKEFLEEMRRIAIHRAEEALALARGNDSRFVHQLGMARLSESPSDAAKRLLAALQAAQFLAFHCMILEMIIEEIQHQARISLAYALTNEPVIDAGLIGTSLPQNWMYNKLKDAVAEINKASLLEEEEAKNTKDRERKQAAEQKRRTREREEAPKCAEEEEALEQQRQKEREEQEERERKEQEEKKQKEREEKERAAHLQAEEEARKGGSRMNTMKPLKIDMDELRAQEEADAAAAAAEAKATPVAKAGAGKQRPQQQGGKGASEPSPSGRRDIMTSRYREKEQRYHHQGHHDCRGWKEGVLGQQGAPSGPGNARGEPGQRKGSSGQQQQQQQQAQAFQNATQIKQRDGSSGAQMAQGGGTGTAAAGAPNSGRDTGKSGQASHQPHSGSGKGSQQGGPGSQQQQLQGGKGSQSVKGGGGGSAKAASAEPHSASQQRIVPGFDPAHNQRTDSQKPRQRRPRRGGGGGSQGDIASIETLSGATITGPKEPVTWLDRTGASTEAVNDKSPHPPASVIAEGEADVEVVLDLTEPEQQLGLEADQQETQYEDHMAKYPYVHPYPFDPPEGWMVHEGFLFPATQNPEAMFSVHGKPPNGDDESYRKVFFVALANGMFKDPMYGEPPVPLEAYKTVPVLETQSAFRESSAGSGAGRRVAGGAIPASGSPQPTFNPNAPPFGVGGAPGPWPTYTGLPLQMPIPPFGLPYVGPQGMQGMLPIPYPGILPTQYPYGVPQQLHPPYPPMPVPAEPHEDSGTEEQADTEEDLLDMLLQRQGASTEVAGPPPPPAYAPLTQGIPGPGSFPTNLPFVIRPSMAGVVRMMAPVRPLNVASEFDVNQHSMSTQPSPYSTQIPEEAPARLSARTTVMPVTAPAPSSARQMSWAERTRPGVSTSISVPTVRQPLSPTEDEELQDTEENQMLAAMHQSMRDNMNVAFPPLGGGPLGSGSNRAAGLTVSQELVTVSGGAMGTGLVNRVGEYNCFLNVIIQCLWHCVAFRGRLQAINPADFDAEHRVVAALLRLFHALDAADFMREQQLTYSEVMIERHVVDPSELREALDALGVRAGEMNDASEVMSALFECLNRAPGLSGMDGIAGSGTLSVVDGTFGLLLSEEVRCTVQTCHRITHVVPQHIEYFMILTATGLRDMRAVIDAAPGEHVPTGRIIRDIESQNVKRCDSDPPHHGCNTPTPVTRTLHNVPAVFTVQLAWEPDVPGEAIAGTLSLVDTVLDPKEIFAGGNCPGNMPSYALHGMFCYYGQHYFAFINRGPQEPDSAQEWVMFDDATVLAVGNWSQVIAKCRAGRIQPSVLFYQQYI